MGRFFFLDPYDTPAHLFNDLVELDVASMVWRDLSDQVLDAPSPRYDAGFAAAAGRLCVFGGIQSNANEGTYGSGELSVSSLVCIRFTFFTRCACFRSSWRFENC